MDKFTWRPNLGASRNVKPLVQVTQFGDGYELRSASQLNVNKRIWTMTFTAGREECLDMVAFLDKQQGRLAFNFDDPMGKPGTYVCREWTSSQAMFGVYELQAVFEEVFEY